MLFWLTLVGSLLYASLIGYYIYYWYQVEDFVPDGATGPGGQLSVVVAARNEAGTIGRLLEALLRQTLSPDQFEVIIVNDYSTDDTAGVVNRFGAAHFKLVKPVVPPERSSKKRAIEAGVAAARHPLVVVTDADCCPHPQWLETVISFQQARRAAFVVAPVCLEVQPNTVGVLQLLDFAMLQGITAASVQAGAHSMCNGANLAFLKSEFEAVDGYAGVDELASGDDMLLLYKIWKRRPNGVHYLKSTEAIVPTPGMDGWKSFLRQRIRWSSKATYYQDRRISAVLFFVYGYILLSLILLAAAMLQQQHAQLLAGYLLAKTAAELCLLVPVARFFRMGRQLIWFPLLQPLHILYTVYVGIASRKGSYEWKGRKTR